MTNIPTSIRKYKDKQILKHENMV